MAAKTTRAIAYIRSATPTVCDTADKPLIATQRIREYCQLNGITLVDVLTDVAVSGYGLDARPTLCVALLTLASGRADALIVPSLPMLSRSISELAPWLAEHFGEGRPYRLIAMQENLDTHQATGRLALSMLAGLALFEEGGLHA